MSMKMTTLAILLIASVASAQIQLTTNGGFETGDFTGWQLFPSQAGNITIGPGNGSTFGADVNNTLPASNTFIKHNNLGAGTVMPGQDVAVSFDMRGTTAIGGLVFCQVFSEGSTSQLFGPFFADPNPMVWTTIAFTYTTGTDVTGGISIQLEAVTGGAMGSVAQLQYDNVSATIPNAVMATYPGSGDDLALATGVNGAADSMDIKAAAGGDLLVVNVSSPGAAFDLSPYTLWAQLVPTAGGVPNLAGLGLPDIYLDLALPVFVVVSPDNTSGVGPLLIGPGSGTDHFLSIPSALNGLGQSIVLQSIISSNAANNMIYAATDAHEIQVP